MFNGAVLLFLGGLGYTAYLLWEATTSKDNKDEFDKALRTILYTMTPMILLLMYIAYYYTDMNPGAYKPYLMFVMHLALLFSLMSLSMNTLVKRTA
jgi:hypothetical protein